MSLAIIFIGTKKYREFFDVWYRTADKNLCTDTKRTFIALTDMYLEPPPKGLITFLIEHEPWPFVTLKRWHVIEKARNVIMHHDHVLYLDADMEVVSPIAYAEMFGSGKKYLGIHHPSHWVKAEPVHKSGRYETNPESEAYVSNDMDRSVYWQGCLWGGRSEAVLQMVEELRLRTNLDAARNIIAKWHDESHMNRFFLERKNDIHTLGPEFAYPAWGGSLGLEPRILHVEKKN